MKGTLFFDVDGVILDFNVEFVKLWNAGVDSGKWVEHHFSANPTTWAFGLDPKKDDLTHLNQALDLFHADHEHLPLVHETIPAMIQRLKTFFEIVLVTSYPNESKRIENLALHKIYYDRLVCNVKDKVAFIKQAKQDGFYPEAIFEDGPHHLDGLVKEYPGMIWTPGHWNYLEKYKGDNRIRFYQSPAEWDGLIMREC